MWSRIVWPKRPHDASNVPVNCNLEASSTVNRRKKKLIEIHGQDTIWSIAFLPDGKHIIGGGVEGKIQRWQVEDGEEVGQPMDAGNGVCNIAASRDGKWIVCGTYDGKAIMWDAESHKKVTEFKGHSGWMRGVDFSPDATEIATGSSDRTACVWSVSTGQRLLGPWRHYDQVATVKFSPDGHLIATSTFRYQSFRVYDSYDGRLLVHVPIQVTDSLNETFTWGNNSKQLFVLSCDANIHCLDASNGTTLSTWPIHSIHNPRRISLATTGTFITASANSSVSFWDTTAHEQIGPVIQHRGEVFSMAISSNNDIATVVQNTIFLRSLSAILPSSYCNSRLKDKKADLNENSNSKIVHQEETAEQLQGQLSDSQGAFTRKESPLYETINSLRVQGEISHARIAYLEENLHQLRNQLSSSKRNEDNLNETIKSLRAQDKISSTKIAGLEQTIQQLRTDLADFQQNANSLIRAYEQTHQCETLYAEGRSIDAALFLLGITNTLNESTRANMFIMDWLAEFTNRCISTLETIGDQRSSAERHDESLASYYTALLLSPSTPQALLVKWATKVLIQGKANEALDAAAKFKFPKIFIYRVICDTLEANGRITEAVESFLRMRNELVGDMSTADERVQWELDFRERSVEKLEKLGDAAMDSKDHNAAANYYSDALTLHPTNQSDILLKRGKARTLLGFWGEAIVDADKAIEVDPSSPYGYEQKRAALIGAQRYDEAIDAYRDMLLRLEQSPDPVTRELRNQYVSPSETVTAIRSSFKQHQRDTPLVLINSETGFLCDGDERMAEFETNPTFKSLVASMTKLDNDRIDETVEEYLRYATFSHTWGGAEPLYQDILLHKSVHKLPKSPAFSKLLMFCQIAQQAGLRWMWSDTCCINKMDGLVLQESLTSMFKWYHNSSLTVIHLKGVFSDSDLITLVMCLWNTRAWTLQEFFASRIIQFYTEDWKPYCPHEVVYNHKESPAIMAEMAAATGVDVQVLLSLRPGSDNVRQKLCLAATRVATKQEDMAYSLFGIFDVSIPVTYGEGQERALGRLLQEVLTRSGDVTILAWKGKASKYNSGIPAEISVYRESLSPYIPSLGEDAMLTLVTELTTSSVNLDLAMILYDRVAALPPPHLASRRLKFSCVMFPIRGLLGSGSDGHRVYCAVTSALGKVEIKTTEDLINMENLVLVHPWIQCLVDPAPPFEPRGTDDEIPPLTPVEGDGADGDLNALFAEVHSPSPSHAVSSPPSTQPHLDRLTRSLRLFARLRQPFGALLLVPLSLTEYKRVACDCLIVAQLLANVPPRYLVEKVRTLDIL